MKNRPKYHRSLRLLKIVMGICAFTLLSSIRAQDSNSQFEGLWQGELTAGQRKIVIQFNIRFDQDGKGLVSVNSPTQGVTGIPAEMESVEGNAIAISVPNIRGHFSGKYDSVSQKIEGVWNQGNQLPLALERIAEIAAEKEISEERLQIQLGQLSAKLEELRKENNIPGLALAIVKDDKVIFSKGFGFADVENETPVTSETIFAIGSTTKAFNAVLLKMLEEDGLLDIKAPVSELIPEFKLNIRTDNDEDAVSIEDLISHRTGFPRMSFLWVQEEFPENELFETMAKARPTRPFQKRFQYTNIMYQVSGIAAEKASGQSWEEMIENRIFEPLEMDSTTLSIKEAQKDPSLALGYYWNEDTESFTRLPMTSIVENAAPAGAINSNLEDMTKWIRFLLNEGAVSGKSLISKESLADTWSIRTRIAPTMNYGLGWFLQNWEGKQVVQHGGSIDGFACQVSLIPEAKVGYVLFANVTATALQNTSMELVWKTVLGDGLGEAVPTTAIDFSPYVGEFVGNFASFKNATFTVKEKDGKLAIDVPGQQLYSLKSPDEEGKWFFELTDTIAVSFSEKEEGKVPEARIHQAGRVFNLPRKTAADASPQGIIAKEDLFALMDIDNQRRATEEVGLLRISGKVELPNTGIEGSISAYKSIKDDLFKSKLDFGKFGSTTTHYQKGKGTAGSSFQAAQEMSSKMIENLQIVEGLVDLRDVFPEVLVDEKKEIKGKEYYQVTYSGNEQGILTDLVDTETGDLFQRTASYHYSPYLPPIRLRINFEDYFEFEGIRIPRKTTFRNPQTGLTVITIESVEKVADTSSIAL